jgi:hypothetical protein
VPRVIFFFALLTCAFDEFLEVLTHCDGLVLGFLVWVLLLLVGYGFVVLTEVLLRMRMLGWESGWDPVGMNGAT